MTGTRSASAFFLLVLGVAIPIWLASGRLGVLGSLRIPTSDLVLAFTPMIAALGLVAWREGRGAAASLLRQAFDPRSQRSVGWALATLLLPPGIYLLSWSVMRVAGSDAAMPAPDIARLLVLFVLFVVLAAGEEIGWMGYAFGPLQRRWGSLGASLVLAGPWWLGHLPSMAAIGVSAADMAWWALGAVGLRIVMTWLYNGAGASLSAMVVFHALLNLSRIATFPTEGAHYVGAYQAVAYVIVTVLAAIVVAVTRGRLGEPKGHANA